MWSEKVIYFPFQAYGALKAAPKRDRKDTFLFDLFREAFMHHKSVTYTLDYSYGHEGGDTHHVSILVGPDQREIFTLVSKTFREVFTDVETSEMGVDVINFKSLLEPFPREFVEVPVPTIYESLAHRVVLEWAMRFFPDWDEGMIPQHNPMGLGDEDSFAENVHTHLEKVEVEGYSPAMLQHVTGHALYDLLELSQDRMVFATTRDGKRIWDQIFPKSD